MNKIDEWFAFFMDVDYRVYLVAIVIWILAMVGTHGFFFSSILGVMSGIFMHKYLRKEW